MKPPTRADFEESAALWADPAVTRFIGGRPSTHEESWARLLRSVGHWAVLGFGYWMVRERSSGRFLGEVGFSDFHREVSPPLEGAPELGWVLSPSAQGQGFGIEAVRAALEWADARLGPGRRVCMVAPENARSLLLAGKAGFVEYARGTYKGQVSVLLEHLSAP